MTKKHWLVPTLGIAALLVALVAIPAFADTGTPAQPAAPGTAPCYGGGPAAARGFGGSVTGGISDLLDLSTADLQAARQSGESLAVIAEKQGVSREDLVAGMLKAHQDALAARVQDGTLTQEQADQMLEIMKSRIEQQIDNTNIGPAAGRGAFRGQGMGGGFGRGQGRGGQGMGSRQGFGPGAGFTQNTGVTNS